MPWRGRGSSASAPDVVLVSGDLTEHGDPAEYARVRELLEPLGAPLLALPGNHDDRATLRDAFPATTHEDGAIRVLTLDSSRPGRDDGALGAEQLARLDADLAAGDGRPAIVALHHPPLATGMPFLDDIGLDPGDARRAGRDRRPPPRRPHRRRPRAHDRARACSARRRC